MAFKYYRACLNGKRAPIIVHTSTGLRFDWDDKLGFVPADSSLRVYHAVRFAAGASIEKIEQEIKEIACNAVKWDECSGMNDIQSAHSSAVTSL